ncbi:arsenate reductase [Acinetobacter qingfengensis]|uniref:Arsenate reductase n=1 Tax=Acinetobacter qingfengensis TaxID=1262585 RepID=A0A1E7QWS0_9GAMM|nr:arsenate reductase [Acinetobacter qingfengensis]KAA8731282.1 arsenate reductase [Acinetobacter qingfengensis]OEY91471.1 arsenate reductase [Acinetobacter qingfengensis]
MLIIYGIKNCSTMKKAFTALEQKNLPYQFHDYKKQGIGAEKLQYWLTLVDANLLLNKKGTTWRKLDDEQQAYALANPQQLIETLIAHPSMIKRPVLEHAKGLLVGFDDIAYQQLSQ